MKGLIFTLITLVLGGVIGIGLEKLVSFLPEQMVVALTRVYTIGIHPFGVHLTVCGLIGLIFGYLIICKFVKK